MVPSRPSALLLIEKFHPDGFNIGLNDCEAAGQIVSHAHIHVIPQRRGDTLPGMKPAGDKAGRQGATEGGEEGLTETPAIIFVQITLPQEVSFF